MVKKGSGWHGEPRRHAEAVKKGMKTRYGRPTTTTKRPLKKQLVKSNTLFDYKGMEKARNQITKGLSKKFPYVFSQRSGLDSEQHFAISVTVSKDPKASWSNGFIENSRYGIIYIKKDGTTEQFAGSLKLRRFKGKDINHIIEKINAS